MYLYVFENKIVKTLVKGWLYFVCMLKLKKTYGEKGWKQ